MTLTEQDHLPPEGRVTRAIPLSVTCFAGPSWACPSSSARRPRVCCEPSSRGTPATGWVRAPSAAPAAGTRRGDAPWGRAVGSHGRLPAPEGPETKGSCVGWGLPYTVSEAHSRPPSMSASRFLSVTVFTPNGGTFTPLTFGTHKARTDGSELSRSIPLKKSRHGFMSSLTWLAQSRRPHALSQQFCTERCPWLPVGGSPPSASGR